MPRYRTSPDGTPVPEDEAAPAPEPEAAWHPGMSDHPLPSARQHLPAPERPVTGPKATAARRGISN